MCTLNGSTTDRLSAMAYVLVVNSLVMVRQPVTTPSSESWKFQTLVSRWHEERGATSSITQMATCSAYQEIIGMGSEALPLIFKRLADEGDDPDMWFWALKALTGADPVAPEDRGDFRAMANAWLKWGRDHWYAW